MTAGRSLIALDAEAADAVVAEASRRGWETRVEPLGADPAPGRPGFDAPRRIVLSATADADEPDAAALLRALGHRVAVVADDVRRPLPPPPD
jgi:hypothetical protein